MEQFRKYYELTLIPRLSILETDRKHLVGRLYLGIAIAVVGFFTSLYYFGGFHRFSLSEQSKVDFLVALGVIVVWSVIGSLYYRYYFVKQRNVIRAKYKKDVISDIVKYVDTGLGYFDNKLIEQSEYEESKIFPVKAGYYYGEDYLVGKEGSISYKFSELHTQFIMKDHRGRKAFFTIFQGLFFIADVGKSFDSETVVLPGSTKTLFGKFGDTIRKWRFYGSEQVMVNSEEFTQNFTVYSDKPNVAVELLNESLIQRILDFKKKSGHKIYLSFIGTKVNVAIPLKVDLFEPPIFSTMLDFNGVVENFNYIQLATGLVNDLKL